MIIDRIDVVKPNQMFWRILRAAEKQAKQEPTIWCTGRNAPVLALDPGETTGVAILRDEGPEAFKVELLQVETKNIGLSYEWLRDWLEENNPHHIRCEDYKVYEWKSADHSWSPIHTVQWIGAIRVAAHITETPLSFKMAQHAKTFWTDEKLKLCNVYSPGLKHARDALRHLLYYMCYPNQGD